MQGGLFDLGDRGAQPRSAMSRAAPWGEREHLLQEKAALGFFLSGHPFNAYRAELASFVKRGLGQIEAQREPQLLAGVVLATRTQMTRRGKMAIITLDDGAAQVELTVFNELWEAERNKIKEDELLLVEGKVRPRRLQRRPARHRRPPADAGRGARPLRAAAATVAQRRRKSPDSRHACRPCSPPIATAPARCALLPQHRSRNRTHPAGVPGACGWMTACWRNYPIG